MTEFIPLGEIRRRLGLDNDLDAFMLETYRKLYADMKHGPLMLTTHHGPRPFTVDEALAYGERVARTELG